MKSFMWVATRFAPARLLERGFRASGPKREKILGDILVPASPRKYGKMRQKIGKCPPKPYFSANFLLSRLIFTYFPGEAETFFSHSFSCFGPEAR